MKALTFFTAILLAIVLVFACVQPPDYPDEPIIAFKELNKNQIAQGRIAANSDTLRVVLSFTDGDGNLGNDEGIFDVMLIDSRDGAETPFRLPIVPEQGSGNGISGEINLNIPNTPSNMCCIFNDKNGQDPCTASTAFPTDTFSYTIYIKDRVGNESNRVETEPIVLFCN